jgi:hypothetical protein
LYLSFVAFVAGFVLFVTTVPATFCKLDGRRYFRGDTSAVRAMLHGAGKQTVRLQGPAHFRTGSSRFNGEWQFGTFCMTGAAAAQVWIEHPELRGEALDVINFSTGKLLLSSTRQYDTEAWGNDAMGAGALSDEGHAAFLTYAGFTLGLERIASDANAAAQESIVRSLARRFRAAPRSLIATYPGEWYPVDNAAGIAALALHARVTGADYSDIFERFDSEFLKLIDSDGLLIQAVDGETGAVRDHGRASGTAFAAYLLSYGRPHLAEKLYNTIKSSQYRKLFGFGVVREYGPHGKGQGDIDSGPVMFGLGVSATGFTLGASRAMGDVEGFVPLYGTAHYFGVPADVDDRRNFVIGGPIGDAIMFAMVTAVPLSVVERTRASVATQTSRLP